MPDAETPTPPARQPLTLAALVLLNLALLAGLALIARSPAPAIAQNGGGGVQIGNGNYTMVSGRIEAFDDVEAVYLIETSTMTVVPLVFNSGTNTFRVYDGRPLTEDTPRDARPEQ